MTVRIINPDEKEIFVLDLPIVPIAGDYIKIFGRYYLIQNRCLIVYTESGKSEEFILSVTEK